MEKSVLEELLTEAQKGNELARERLILHYKPYILNTASHLAGKYLTWSDEEASVALISFNRALETFDPHGGRAFLNYVYLLIKRDLIDHYRKEKRNQHFSLDSHETEDGMGISPHEIEKAVDKYEKTILAAEIIEEILELDEQLQHFNIGFEELEEHSPQHRDTRKTLHEMAKVFVNDRECVDILMNKKRLPVSLFVSKTGFSPKTIERYRKYFITLILVRLNPQWEQLSGYIHETIQPGNEGLS